MNNRHRRVARLKKEETESMQLLTEIINLISTRYGVTVSESAQQIQTMIKTNSINKNTVKRRLRIGEEKATQLFNNLTNQEDDNDTEV